MASAKLYVGDELFLRQATPSEVPEGSVVIRVGLVDGTEHHIAIAPKALTYSITDGILMIVSDEGIFRRYATWAWVDEAPHKKTRGLVV